MAHAPLAERMRPQNIEQYIGQEHLISPQGPLYKAIQNGVIPSVILWGPPGVGKTTLAQLLAKHCKAHFYTLSAVSSNVKEVREVIEKAKFQDRTILFIDEIHRFNKSQQDALLGAVEKGIITLIGATTENPSFEVVSALLSRCQVYHLKSLEKNDLQKMIERALNEDELLKRKNITFENYDALIEMSGGDGRKLYNILELVNSHASDQSVITNEEVISICQKKIVLYDKNGEMHYDVISAFIKSIRGSDPNAAVYWLSRMIQGGEDLKFIARRLVILASEDIGNANPNALLLANNCFQAVNVVGYPESEIILSQCVTYLASSPKSNASYVAIKTANVLVQQTGNLPVPMYLRNAPTKLLKNEGYGKGYTYAHNYENNFSEQEYFPTEIAHTKLYDPGSNARENELRLYLKKLWGDKYKY
ncbi:MAG: replication-associated recombination protein A [Cytophagales bacterium]